MGKTTLSFSGKNVGSVSHAGVGVKPLPVLCGDNNTGTTLYRPHALVSGENGNCAATRASAQRKQCGARQPVAAGSTRSRPFHHPRGAAHRPGDGQNRNIRRAGNSSAAEVFWFVIRSWPLTRTAHSIQRCPAPGCRAVPAQWVRGSNVVCPGGVTVDRDSVTYLCPSLLGVDGRDREKHCAQTSGIVGKIAPQVFYLQGVQRSLFG